MDLKSEIRLLYDLQENLEEQAEDSPSAIRTGALLQACASIDETITALRRLQRIDRLTRTKE